ncbi:translation initiation factor IF-2 [Buchnera aphidicola]|uniref:translation initiation factor IF-2 n=1 Tax=Buchnera aphidicola TaxID=9 RepID=UPI003464BD28
MDHINLKLLSKEINISIDQLINKLAEIGIVKTKFDYLDYNEKKMLLNHLNIKKENNENTFILQRKKHSTLNFSTANGKNKLIQVEVRKKHIYFKQNIEENIPVNHTRKILNNKEKKISAHILISPNIVQKKNNSKTMSKRKLITTPLIKNQSSHIATNSLTKEYKMKDRKNKTESSSRTLIEKRTKLNDKLKNWVIKNNEKTELLSRKFFNNHSIEDNKNLKTEKIHRDRIKNHKNYIPKKKNNNHFSNKIDKENKNIIIKHNNKNKNKNYLSLQQSFQKPLKIINRDIFIRETITVSELAKKMSVKTSAVIKKIFLIENIKVTGDKILDQDIAQLIAEEMGHKVILQFNNELEKSLLKDRDKGITSQFNRAPIVTVMGHVDHGKTSLLDYIRSTNIAKKESGGITQHIGAYHVKTESGIITFLDTPGHSAFTSMRARGVHATDLVVLVVAADDGVKPQTIEAIQHAKAAKVPVLVAINKIDKNESNPEEIKNQLTKHGIVPESWGGENIFVNVSAKTGEGIQDLLSAILLQSELLELRSVSNGMAIGVVIESYLDKGRGPVATVLVKEGVLNKGDIVLCGFEYGRVRGLLNELGQDIQQAGPSIPVAILGLSGVPSAGDLITVVRNEKKAREVAMYRKDQFRITKLSLQKKTTLENMFQNVNGKNNIELNIILKTDVQGSLEAISDALINISNHEVVIKIIGSGVGGITETDASLASASNAIIVGFNVRADNSARRIIELDNIDLRYYSVIYNLIDEVKASMLGMLSPKYKQEIIGLAEVRNIFKSPKFGHIAGCMVIEGIIKKSKPIRVLRNNIVIYEGELESLRRFKEDVNEVRNGMECGIGVKNYNDIHVHDIIEVFKTVSIIRNI